MSKINSKELYQEIARQIPRWPICPYTVYTEWTSWGDFFGKDKIISERLKKEWHPTKNGSLTPQDVTCGSHKKVWWKCQEGHEWENIVGHRHYRGQECPYCQGRKVNQENCLATVNSKLAQEWHPTKNGSLTPQDVTCGSGKMVWWKCKKGHEWQTTPLHRKTCGCPYCSGKKTCKGNCLATVNPKLAQEWHPTKNGKLTPKDVTLFSNKRVWWQCKKGHEWEVKICSRSKGTGCPYCAGKRVCRENSFAAKKTELVKEWHPTKNGKLTPQDVTCCSHKKIWWKCKKGHEWRIAVYNRTAGSGCPNCRVA